MNARFLNRLPLIVICIAVVSIIATPAIITFVNRRPNPNAACRETDRAFSEYALSQDISLSYRPLSIVIDDQTDTAIVGGRSPVIDFFHLTDENQFLPSLNTTFNDFHALALNQEAGYLVGGTSDGATVVWQRDSASETGWNANAVTLPGRLGSHISAVAISPTGKLISASSKDTIFVWQKKEGSDEWVRERDLYSAHSGNDVLDLAFDKYENLFSVGNDSRIKVWATAGGSSDDALSVYNAKDNVESIVLNTKTETIFAGLKNGFVEVWNANFQQNSEAASSLNVALHSQPVKSLALSGQENLLVSGSNDKTVTVWSLCTEEILQTFEEHSDWVSSVDVSLAGRTIVSTGIDNRLIVRSR